MKTTTSPLTPETLRLLRDRNARPHIASGAHADALLRRHVLVQIAESMRQEKLTALLVKGAALALTVYPDAAARRMSDIDMLVDEKDQSRAVDALGKRGWLVAHDSSRPLSTAMFGERLVQARVGSMTFTVEVHASLDKMVRRPIAFPDLVQESSPAPGLEGLSVPGREDHALLVALHASTHEYRHELALQDLELLLRSGLDKRKLSRRAEQFQLRPVMFVMLSVLENLGAASVNDELVRMFDPGWVRRRFIARFYDVHRYPPVLGEEVLGFPWVLRQAPLWENPRMFAKGLVKYAGVRVVERGLDVVDDVRRRVGS